MKISNTKIFNRLLDLSINGTPTPSSQAVPFNVVALTTRCGGRFNRCGGRILVLPPGCCTGPKEYRVVDFFLKVIV